MLLEDDRRRGGVEIGCADAFRVGRRVAFVDLVHRQPEAGVERAMSRLMTSAESRLAAISKVVRVRVEFSKKRLKTLLPRRSGTFLTSRSLTLRNVPAVSRMCCRIGAGSPSIESRWMSSSLRLSWGLRLPNMDRPNVNESRS